MSSGVLKMGRIMAGLTHIIIRVLKSLNCEFIIVNFFANDEDLNHDLQKKFYKIHRNSMYTVIQLHKLELLIRESMFNEKRY